MATTAFFVDGGYFLRRYTRTYGQGHDAARTAKKLFEMCLNHLAENEKHDLYRIFFYDCPPLAKKVHHPITKQAIDFSKTPQYTFRKALHAELVRLRKVALRLGKLGEKSGAWVITPSATRELFSGKRTFSELTEHDVKYDVRQKGVDMRIGLDIASIAYKGLVRKVVLIAGDSDFVPAAKLARREGIDFILDPMWNQNLSEDLFEHIDGVRSVCPRPRGTEPPAVSGPLPQIPAATSTAG